MREILFRGKRKNNGEWVEGYYIHIPEGEGTYDEERHLIQQIHNNGIIGFSVDVIPKTVGQYTGLSDKNGKKIFEGDIVKLALMDCAEIGVIKFNDIMCRFMFYDKFGGYGIDNTCDFEVIGNTHDNPDMLKGGGEG